MMRINYLLGFPTFLMIIGLAWVSQSHAALWHSQDRYAQAENDLPEVETLLNDDEPSSSFELKEKKEPENNLLELFQKVDTMQGEIQELRGKVEQQDYDLKALKKWQASLAESHGANLILETNKNNTGITYNPSVK